MTAVLDPPLWHEAAACLVLLALTLPPGYALSRLLRLEIPRMAGLAVALGLGYATLLPLFLIERAAGIPALAAGAACGALLWLRPGPAAARALRGWRRELLVPLAAAGLALTANAGDVGPAAEGGLSFRIGFDVSDRVFYATVAQELLRAPAHRLENPLFAGLPLQYGVLPGALAALASHYSGLDPVAFLAWPLSAFGLFWTSAAVMGFCELALGSRLTPRVLAAALVALGGDLSFLVPTANVLERTRHFWVFHSFSAEALLYNPWTLGAPLLFCGLLVAMRALEGSHGATAAAGLLIGSLWPTKPFAFVCLLAALAFVAVVTRRAAPLVLLLSSLVCGAPWLALAVRTGWSGDAPFVVSPFYPAYSLLAASPQLDGLVSRLGLLGEEPRGSLPGLVVLSLLCLVGALGVRLLGLRALVRRARHGSAAIHRVVAAAAAVGALLAFSVVGSPTALEGTQFLMVALYLLWPYAAESLGSLAGGPPLGRLAAVVLVAAAVVGPLGYLARKRLPERLTAAASWDSRRFVLGAPTLEACRWLREGAAPGARLALPLRGDPENLGGLLPLYVAAASARRVVAGPTDVHVSPRLGNERRALTQRLFEARSAEELDGLLDALGVDWIWEPPDFPLAVRSRNLELRFASARVRLYRRSTATGDRLPAR